MIKRFVRSKAWQNIVDGAANDVLAWLAGKGTGTVRFGVGEALAAC